MDSMDLAIVWGWESVCLQMATKAKKAENKKKKRNKNQRGTSKQGETWWKNNVLEEQLGFLENSSLTAVICVG